MKNKKLILASNKIELNSFGHKSKKCHKFNVDDVFGPTWLGKTQVLLYCATVFLQQVSM